MAARKRVLAVASAGGHWQQLQQLKTAFDDQDVHFVTTLEGLPEQYGISNYTLVRDCNRNERVAMVVCALQLASILLRKRPHVIISTGALPGFFALALGRLIRSRTIWVDSVANGEEMSMAGAQAKRFADLWMSQWEHVAAHTGAVYRGSVL
jgi:UDP-N-acetylglucosamine:LPS N-acetylglucosamine transferase